jgi:hypothetical protein
MINPRPCRDLDVLIIAPLSHMNDLIVQVRSTVGSAAQRGAGAAPAGSVGLS